MHLRLALIWMWPESRTKDRERGLLGVPNVTSYCCCRSLGKDGEGEAAREERRNTAVRILLR